jgi:hypothetical protein
LPGGLKTGREPVVFVIDDAALDVSTRKRIESQLRAAELQHVPLVIDCSKVRYADRLGLETLFDFLIERTAPVAFSGVCRDIEHFFWRLQILPLLPIASSVEDAASLIESAS